VVDESSWEVESAASEHPVRKHKKRVRLQKRKRREKIHLSMCLMPPLLFFNDARVKRSKSDLTFETNIFFYHNMKKFALQPERNKEIG
jgi:hypothetical protein